MSIMGNIFCVFLHTQSTKTQLITRKYSKKVYNSFSVILHYKHPEYTTKQKRR